MQQKYYPDILRIFSKFIKTKIDLDREKSEADRA